MSRIAERITRSGTSAYNNRLGIGASRRTYYGSICTQVGKVEEDNAQVDKGSVVRLGSVHGGH